MFSDRLFLFRGAILHSIALSGLASPALAQAVGSQAGSPDSGEIVVTATKIATPLSRVPISVSAYSQDSMDARSIREVRGLVAQTPGIDLTEDTRSVGGYRLAIRGIDSNAGGVHHRHLYR